MKSRFLPFAAYAIATATSMAAPPVLSLTQAALQGLDPDIKPDHYEIARTDLDSDGSEDVLALMNGKSGYCGSGGCTLFVLKGKNGGFESLGSIKVVNRPIYVRKDSSKGMRDLLVTVRGGGATPGVAALKFDGESYPPSPGDAAAAVGEGDSVLFAENSVPYEKSLELQGITFKVSSPNSAPSNRVTIVPAGLEADNSTVTVETPGIVTGTEVGDINADGSPEIYVYTTDVEERGNLIAFSANKKKSLSQISFPELGEHSQGYRGGDEYAVVEGVIARRFPLYPVDATKTEPTRKIRQIQYKLQAGEAGWLLKVDKVIEF
ncbi:MAG: hypothetical protein EOP83_26930 [Verrucomicrobiaceae bacterium]|nr:MAG: hypothetical protein EOP83_26930 [Verrucomicrobiaceae bacterium]